MAASATEISGEWLAVVESGRRRQSRRPVAQEYLVDVELENLVLERLFSILNEQDFVKFAAVGLFAGEKEVAGDLLGDGGGALFFRRSSGWRWRPGGRP